MDKGLGRLFSSASKSEPVTPEQSAADREFWLRVKKFSHYDWPNKEKHVGPLLKQLDEAEMVGNTVLDIGAGPRPVSSFLKREGRSLFAVDFVRPLVAHDFHHIRGDIRQAHESESFAMKRAIVQIAEKMGVDPRTAGPQQVDTMIFSDILNYLPYEDTVRALSHFLKRGGLLIVLNQPGRTFEGGEKLLHPKGPKNVGEMMRTLEGLGFRLVLNIPFAETNRKGKDRFVPVRTLEGASDNDPFMMFAVLRKENVLERAYNKLRHGLRNLSEENDA